jgi:hypothetical protein
VTKPGDGGPVSHRRGCAASGSAPDVLPEKGGTSEFEKSGEIWEGLDGDGGVEWAFPSLDQAHEWMVHRLEAEGCGEEFAVEVEFRG